MDSKSTEMNASSITKPVLPHTKIIKTPCPYETGKPIDLAITKTFSDEIEPNHLIATITKVYSMTMSPVVEISFKVSGVTKKAVLKAYDRRFGQSFRRVRDFGGRTLPHTNAAQRIWEEYVRDGKAKAFLEEFKALREREDILGPCAEELLEDLSDKESVARYEGALQYEALESFDMETKAYERLSDLQGKGVPKLLAHVRVYLELSSDLEAPDYAGFFRINGILMDQIDGFRLSDLASSPLPMDKWDGILQRTIDLATEINMKGVIMGDCRPSNVLIDGSGGMPFIHDFAASSTLDTNDKEFGYRVIETQNPKSSVASVVNRLQKEKDGEIGKNLVLPVLHELVGLTKEEAEECWQIVL